MYSVVELTPRILESRDVELPQPNDHYAHIHRRCKENHAAGLQLQRQMDSPDHMPGIFKYSELHALVAQWPHHYYPLETDAERTTGWMHYSTRSTRPPEGTI